MLEAHRGSSIAIQAPNSFAMNLREYPRWLGTSSGRWTPAGLDFVWTRISRGGRSPRNAARYIVNQCPFSNSRNMGESQQAATTRLVDDSSLSLRLRSRRDPFGYSTRSFR